MTGSTVIRRPKTADSAEAQQLLDQDTRDTAASQVQVAPQELQSNVAVESDQEEENLISRVQVAIRNWERAHAGFSQFTRALEGEAGPPVLKTTARGANNEPMEVCIDTNLMDRPARQAVLEQLRASLGESWLAALNDLHAATEALIVYTGEGG